MESRKATDEWFKMLNPRVKWSLAKRYICPKCLPNEYFIVYHSKHGIKQICSWCKGKVKDLKQDTLIICK